MVSKPVKTPIPIAGEEMQIKVTVVTIRLAKTISSVVDEAYTLLISNVVVFTN